MEFKDLNKEILCFWKTALNGRKTQEKAESEEKVLVMNSRENKCKNKNSKFFKSKCNKCGKYGHRASNC